jgi:hypothetical protein
MTYRSSDEREKVHNGNVAGIGFDTRDIGKPVHVPAPNQARVFAEAILRRHCTRIDPHPQPVLCIAKRRYS